MMKSMEGSCNGLLHDPVENNTLEASHQNTVDGRTVFHSKPDTVIQTKAVHDEKHVADPAPDNQSTEHKSGPSGVNGATTDNETDHENVGSSETKDDQRFDSQSFVGRLMVNSILVTRELNGVLSEKIAIYDPVVCYLGNTLRYANDCFQESVKSAAQKADDIEKEANLAARTAKDYCETEEEECVSVVNQLKTAPLKVLNTLLTEVEKISKALLLKNGKVGSIQLKPGCKEVYSVAVDPALKLIGSQTEFVLKLLNGISTKEKKLTELNKYKNILTKMKEEGSDTATFKQFLDAQVANYKEEEDSDYVLDESHHSHSSSSSSEIDIITDSELNDLRAELKNEHSLCAAKVQELRDGIKRVEKDVLSGTVTSETLKDKVEDMVHVLRNMERQCAKKVDDESHKCVAMITLEIARLGTPNSTEKKLQDAMKDSRSSEHIAEQKGKLFGRLF